MVSEEQMKEVLIRQRQIILNKEYGIERTALKEIEAKSKIPHVVVLTGLRRSGKSTLLRQLISKQYKDKDFYYINFEDERLFNFPASEFNKLYEVLISLFGAQKTFFIDEIQNVSGFETFVRRFYEEGFKFFITGSSAALLSRELGTKLTGRHVDIVVKPFSFLEFLKMKKCNVENDALYKTESKIAIKKYFEEYLSKGGMPEYVIYDDQELLTKVYEDTVIKDIAVRHKIDNVAVLKELYQYLITNFANKFSFNALKKLMNFGSVNTVKKFIAYLEETYFAKTINKFDYALRKQIRNYKKFYVVDNGFIEIISKKLTKDKGWLLENLVFNSLNKAQDIFYYADKGECDFLLVKNKTVEQAIQVCFDLNEGNKEREIFGLREAMEKFKLKTGLILTSNQEDEIKDKNKVIKVMPVWKWLLEH